MTYLLLSAALLATAVVVRVVAHVVVRSRGERLPVAPSAIAAGVLVVLTVVFDNAMIAAGLFAYADAHISGIRIGLVPIEDLSYPLAAAIALPGVWALVHGRRRRSHE
ncbi:lycopene cyclase domain-containing protein [Microbacterium sp.]|uniref:lycopene cyclase domain-containing protein n=1 Tax=Microbacterium sp. TaxID=51671 RepID=UPI001AD00A23|nr:lycopene cyclase domain-containing protein [Microbacterium sp.]MBN9184276.1 lycopene cyclase domain-containing protein [Microbacterium sp.]MBN9191012.1 lycopene cyclase domain-containing protein [Microbacterium sp.]